MQAIVLPFTRDGWPVSILVECEENAYFALMRRAVPTADDLAPMPITDGDGYTVQARITTKADDEVHYVDTAHNDGRVHSTEQKMKMCSKDTYTKAWRFGSIFVRLTVGIIPPQMRFGSPIKKYTITMTDEAAEYLIFSAEVDSDIMERRNSIPSSRWRTNIRDSDYYKRLNAQFDGVIEFNYPHPLED